MSATTRKRPTRAEWLGSRGERARLMSTDDVAALFGVTRQRVGQIRREQPTFPRRQIELDGGPLWIRTGIEVWSGLHRPGALPEGSVLAPHGVRLLAAAESVAASLGLSYVGVSQLWLAVISDDPAVRKVFASLGASEPSFAASPGGTSPRPTSRRRRRP